LIPDVPSHYLPLPIMENIQEKYNDKISSQMRPRKVYIVITMLCFHLLFYVAFLVFIYFGSISWVWEEMNYLLIGFIGSEFVLFSLFCFIVWRFKRLRPFLWEKISPTPQRNTEELQDDRFKERQNIISEEPLIYSGVLSAIKDFCPTLSCKESVAILSNEGVTDKLDLIIKECLIWVETYLTSPNSNPFNLTEDEIFAICIYTYDLGFKGNKEENFYFQFNKMLLKRNGKALQIWAPYLYYLQKVKTPTCKMYSLSWCQCN